MTVLLDRHQNGPAADTHSLPHRRQFC